MGRSYCPNCRGQLRWYDLFPILSYLLTFGRCRLCQNKIPWEYPLTEALTAIIIGFLFFTESPLNTLNLPIQEMILPFGMLLLKIIIICTMIITLLTDLKAGIIPDRITYPAAFWSLSIICGLLIYQSWLLFQSLNSSSLGKYLLPPYSNYYYLQIFSAAGPLIAGLASALGIGLFFATLIIVTRGRGMGGGDLKLGVYIGLVLGFPASLVALMLSFLTGSIAGIGLLLLGKKHFGQTIPFGPFLSIGTIISLFWGNDLVSWYLNYRPY